MPEKHYDRAPVVEAIIDIQTEFDQAPSEEKFVECHEAVADRLPVRAPLQFVQLGFSRAGETAADWKQSVSESQVGLRLSSDNSNRVLQLQNRGFTYSHMPPYSNWETFSSEAKYLWRIFAEKCGPARISRCSTRFINRINIPHGNIDLATYFNLRPSIPDALPEVVTGMFMQLQMPLTKISENAVAVVNLGMTAPEKPDTSSVLLDFDLVNPVRLDSRSEDIWKTLDELRNEKNIFFEACITDNVRSLIS